MPIKFLAFDGDYTLWPNETHLNVTLSMLETAIEVTERPIPATDLGVILDWGHAWSRSRPSCLTA